MTKEREALKLTLAALEVANSCVDGYYIPKGKTQLPEVEEAITAIKEALAQPEFVLNGIDCSCGRKWRVVNNTLTASAQPEQEPCHHRIADIRNEAVKSGYMCMDCGALFGAYTTPPQRTWVGLTADELNMIGDKMRTWNSHSLTDVYVAIEAKLKEKNI